MYKLLSTSLLAAASLFSSIGHAETVYAPVQCWAEGNSFRVNGFAEDSNLVSARLFLNLNSEGEGKILKNLYGHVSGAKFVDGLPRIAEVDFYSQFNAKDLANSLSPRARKYKDADYWRFNDLTDSSSSSHDGGGMWATLVVSKKIDSAEVRNGERFPAHLIFQHGDHTGGTLDLTCSMN